jgi:hypothetical protein
MSSIQNTVSCYTTWAQHQLHKTFVKPASDFAARFHEPNSSFTSSLSLKFLLVMQTNAWFYPPLRDIVIIENEKASLIDMLCDEKLAPKNFADASRAESNNYFKSRVQIIGQTGLGIFRTAVISPIGMCYNTAATVSNIAFLVVQKSGILGSSNAAKAEEIWQKVKKHTNGFIVDLSYPATFYAGAKMSFAVIHIWAQWSLLPLVVATALLALAIIRCANYAVWDAIDCGFIFHDFSFVPDEYKFSLLTAIIARQFYGLSGKGEFLLHAEPFQDSVPEKALQSTKKLQQELLKEIQEQESQKLQSEFQKIEKLIAQEGIENERILEELQKQFKKLKYYDSFGELFLKDSNWLQYAPNIFKQMKDTARFTSNCLRLYKSVGEQACSQLRESLKEIERASFKCFHVSRQFALLQRIQQYLVRMSVNFYKILGVSSTASASQIKAAYRKKALICHPDKASQNNLTTEKATEVFRQVHEAYETLSDPEKRKLYDTPLHKLYKTFVKSVSDFAARFHEPNSSFTSSLSLKFLLLMQTNAWFYPPLGDVITIENKGKSSVDVLCNKLKEVRVFTASHNDGILKKNLTLINQTILGLFRSAVIAPIGVCGNAFSVITDTFVFADQKFGLLHSKDEAKAIATWQKVEKCIEGLKKDISYPVVLYAGVRMSFAAYSIYLQWSLLPLMIAITALAFGILNCAEYSIFEVVNCYFVCDFYSSVPHKYRPFLIASIIARQFYGVTSEEGSLLDTNLESVKNNASFIEEAMEKLKSCLENMQKNQQEQFEKVLTNAGNELTKDFSSVISSISKDAEKRDWSSAMLKLDAAIFEQGLAMTELGVLKFFTGRDPNQQKVSLLEKASKENFDYLQVCRQLHILQCLEGLLFDPTKAKDSH